MLKKHTGTTTDNHGCQFSYTCLTTIHYLHGQKITWRIYICNEFPAVEANDLNELKSKMSEI